MKRPKDTTLHEVTITKLVHGGQGLGELPDGKKVFVWNALPGEVVKVRIIKHKRSFAEGIAEEVLKASSERIEPLEDNYLATSPWQMMTFAAENHYKSEIVKELFIQNKVDVTKFNLTTVWEEQPERKQRFSPGAMTGSPQNSVLRGMVRNPLAGVSWCYRNKMEYSFWGDQDGLHLALHRRGSHGKQIVQGSVLAMPAVDTAANAVLHMLQAVGVRAGDLKSLIVRCTQDSKAAAVLYVKQTQFASVMLPSEVQGLRIYHSNPKSPASVPTLLLQDLGDGQLSDTLLGQQFVYDAESFFQVNLPVYEKALSAIKAACVGGGVTDMYAGVGSIGLSVAKQRVTLVELDPATAAMARRNAAAAHIEAEVVEASTEKALQYITTNQPVIFDPPRAGLHVKVIERCLAERPPHIIYLSCNPATQARDVALLQQAYELTDLKVYNFFPRTPHIETLAILRRRNARLVGTIE